MNGSLYSFVNTHELAIWTRSCESASLYGSRTGNSREAQTDDEAGEQEERREAVARRRADAERRVQHEEVEQHARHGVQQVEDVERVHGQPLTSSRAHCRQRRVQKANSTSQGAFVALTSEE